MSASPPKEPDVEQNAAQSPNNGEQPMDPSDPHGPSMGYEFEVKEQDRWLPIANVARIMKLALPENAKIAKEAKECMQECVSEFISFITSEASEKCHQEKRKTVNGEDILFAMTSLGFENYAEALKIYLAKYRESQSARSENQQRPASQGFHGREAGSSGSGANPASGGNFDAPQSTNNNLLGNQPAEGGEHDPTGGFGALYETGLPGVQNGSAGSGGY